MKTYASWFETVAVILLALVVTSIGVGLLVSVLDVIDNVITG